jgi:hypothetical protein
MTDLNRVDHLIYGTPDLALAVDRLEELIGVPAAPGGQHLGHGTRNALLSIGASTYLEILGPDPEQPEPDEPRWLSIDDLTEPRLIAWAAKETHLDRFVATLSARGLSVGAVQEGHRVRSDGSRLDWLLTDPEAIQADGLVPFFIDWGENPHPALSAPGGATLTAFSAEYPAPETASRILEQLGVDLVVAPADAAALVATLETPKGTVILR